MRKGDGVPASNDQRTPELYGKSVRKKVEGRGLGVVSIMSAAIRSPVLCEKSVRRIIGTI